MRRDSKDTARGDESSLSPTELRAGLTLRVGEPVPAVALAAAAVLSDVFALRNGGRLRDELLAAVSHELRTPLTVISGVAAFLARHGGTIGVEARVEAVGQLIIATRRMERVVENMLQLPQLEPEVDREPVLAQAILTRAMQSHAADFPRVSVSQLGHDRHAVVYAVESWSVLALTNLLHNAALYGDPSEPPLVEVLVVGDEVHFRVCSAGAVFTDEEFSALFEPYFRRAEVRDRIPGAGLGLATARKLAEAQGGRVLAGPRPDHRGPMFTLALPAYRAPQTGLPIAP